MRCPTSVGSEGMSATAAAYEFMIQSPLDFVCRHLKKEGLCERDQSSDLFCVDVNYI